MFTNIKLYVFLAAFFIATVGSSYVTHRVDVAKLQALELQYAQAETKAVEQAKAVQAAEDKVSLDAAVAEAAAQQKIVTVTQTITKEVVRHVKDHSDCITYGLVRVLDAGVYGADPDSLPLPAGKSDDACAPVTASSLATAILNNYGLARANAEQLNALEAWVKATIHASSGSTTSGPSLHITPAQVHTSHTGTGATAPALAPPG